MTRWLRHPVVWLPISIGLLAFIAWRSRAWEIADQLGSVEPIPLLAAILLNVVVALAWAARSADLLDGAGWSVPVLPLVPMTVFANLINNITPGSVGELVRLYLLRVRFGVAYTAGAAVILIERLVSIAYLGASAVILWFGSRFAIPWPLIAAAALAVAVAPIAVYRSPLRLSRVATALPIDRLIGHSRWHATKATIGRIEETIAELMRRPRRAGPFALACAVVFTSNTLQLVLVGRALGIEVDPVTAWGALGIGVVVGVISLLPFGLGSTDLVVTGLLVATGVALPDAAAVAFGYRVVSTLPMGIAGVVSYALLSANLPETGTAGAIRAAGEELAADGELARSGEPT